MKPVAFLVHRAMAEPELRFTAPEECLSAEPLYNLDMPKLRRAVKALIRAELDNDNKGGSHPEDWPLIERELKSARAVFWGIFAEKPR